MEANRPSVSHTTHTAPRDIACVSIDTSASCAERIKQYVEQVGDPYCYPRASRSRSSSTTPMSWRLTGR